MRSKIFKKKNSVSLVIAFCIHICISVAYSQLGKQHIFTPLHSAKAIKGVHLYLSTPETTAFDVEIKDNKGTVLHTLNGLKNTNPLSFDLTPNISRLFVDRIENGIVLDDKGIIVEGAKSFYAELRFHDDVLPNNSRIESILSRANEALGKDFYIGGKPNKNSTPPEYVHTIGIMAIADNTVINIDKYDADLEFESDDLAVKKTDDALQFTLNKGQSVVVTIYGSVSLNDKKDMVGAYVSSDKPIVVETGNLGEQNFLADQIVPTNKLSKEFVIVKGKNTQGGEHLIVSTQDNTEIRVNNNNLMATINKGDVHVIQRSNFGGRESMYLTATNPIYLYQLLSENNVAKKEVAISFATVPGLPHKGRRDKVVLPNTLEVGALKDGISEAYILTEKSAQITIGGKALKSIALPILGNDDWVLYKEPLVKGDLVLIDSNKSLSVALLNLPNTTNTTGFLSYYASSYYANDSRVGVCYESDVNILDEIGFRPTRNGTWNPAFSSGNDIFNSKNDAYQKYVYSYTNEDTGKVETLDVNIETLFNLDLANLNIPTWCKNKNDKEWIGKLNAPNIENGEYELEYEITEVNSTKGIRKMDIIIKDSEADIPIDTSLIPNKGMSVFTLRSITDKIHGCKLTKSISSAFIVKTAIDLSTIQLSGPSVICSGNDYTTNIESNTFGTATYDITFRVKYTGGTFGPEIKQQITFNTGISNITLPPNIFPREGPTVLQISEIQKNNECSYSIEHDIKTLTIQKNIDASALSIDMKPCNAIGNDYLVRINAPNLADGPYIFTYSVDGVNPLGKKPIKVNISKGKGEFTISSENLLNKGDSTFKMHDVGKENTNCVSTIGIDKPIKLISDFGLSSLRTSKSQICIGDPGGIDIEIKALELSPVTDVTLKYELVGANASKNPEVIDLTLNTLGVAKFNIPTTKLTEFGNTTIRMISITSKKGDCEYPISQNNSSSILIKVYPSPDLKPQDIVLNNICLGSSAIVLIEQDYIFPSGVYKIDYSIEGANTAMKTTREVIVTKENNKNRLKFDISAQKLTNKGETTLRITKIELTGSPCIENTDITKSFDIYDAYIGKVNTQYSEMCSGNSFLNISEDKYNLPSGDYRIKYTVNNNEGAKPHSVEASSNTGNMELILPKDNFIEGDNEIIIDSIYYKQMGCKNKFGADLVYNVNKKGMFIDNTNLDMKLPNIYCVSNLGLDVFIKGQEELYSNTNNEYQINYDLIGANNSTNVLSDITMDLEGAKFNIPNKSLENKGETELVVKYIKIKDYICKKGDEKEENFFRKKIKVADIPKQEPLVSSEYFFCPEDDPTLKDIININAVNDDVHWFGTKDLKDPLTESTSLVVQTTIYVAKVNKDGCRGPYVASKIDISLCENIKYPKGITPNGDGINDVFRIDNIEKIYPNYRVEIYNRLGQLIYVVNKNTGGFDKTSSNMELTQLAPSQQSTGIYYYILYYNSPYETKRDPIQGYFSIKY